MKYLLIAIQGVLPCMATLYGQAGFNRLYNYTNSTANGGSCIQATDSAYFIFGAFITPGQIGQGLNFYKLDTNGIEMTSSGFVVDTSILYYYPGSSYLKGNEVIGMGSAFEMRLINGNYRGVDTFTILAAYNLEGNLTSLRELRITANPAIVYNYVPYDLIFLDTGYLLLAEKWEQIPQDDRVDISLIWLDTTFNVIRTVDYGIPGGNVSDETRPSIARRANGYMLLYHSFYFGGGDIYRVVHILKLDSAGNTLYHYVTPNNEDKYAWKLKKTSDNGYVYCGWSNNQALGDDFNQSYVCKVDSNLQFIWDRKFGKAELFNEMLSIHELPDGNLAGAGDMVRYVRDANNLNDSLIYSGYLTKLSPAGDSLWMRYYEIVPTQNSFHNVWDMKPCPDGGFVFCGDAYDYFDRVTYPQRAWVVKTDSFGCVVPGCQLYDAIHEPPSPAQPIPILVYPNPASSVVNVYLPPFASQVEGLSYTLTDMQGRRVKEWAADGPGGTTYMVPVGDLAAGVYVLTLWGKGKVVGAKELIIDN